MEHEHDLTTEILDELRLIIGFARVGHYAQPEVKPGVKFAQGYFSRMAMFWLYGDSGYLLNHNISELRKEHNRLVPRHRTLLAMADICIEIDLHEHTTGAGIMRVLAERNRQVSRERTIARDKSLYKGDELLKFAMHRLTGELRFYPFSNPLFSNVVKKPDFLTCQVQAGALILAHIQKELKPGTLKLKEVAS